MADTHTPGDYPSTYGNLDGSETAQTGSATAPLIKFGAPTVSLGENNGDAIVQSGSQTQGGNLREFKDEHGNTCVIMVSDEHLEFSINAILAKDVTAKKVGEAFSLGIGDKTITVRVTSWNENWSNEDATSVSIACRTYPSIDGKTATTLT